MMVAAVGSASASTPPIDLAAAPPPELTAGAEGAARQARQPHLAEHPPRSAAVRSAAASALFGLALWQRRPDRRGGLGPARRHRHAADQCRTCPSTLIPLRPCSRSSGAPPASLASGANAPLMALRGVEGAAGPARFARRRRPDRRTGTARPGWPTSPQGAVHACRGSTKWCSSWSRPFRIPSPSAPANWGRCDQ